MRSRRGIPFEQPQAVAGSVAGPPVRAEGLVVERVGAELLVYDGVADAAHCLSADAAVVFEGCDGVRDAAGLCAATGLRAETVQRVLGELDELGLLHAMGPPTSGPGGERVRRREALKRLAKISAAATAAPLIVSAVLETPAAFASGGTGSLGDPCMTMGDSDSCGPGLMCDSNSNDCIPENCNTIPCTPGESCDLGVLTGMCSSVGFGTGFLCC